MVVLVGQELGEVVERRFHPVDGAAVHARSAPMVATQVFERTLLLRRLDHVDGRVGHEFG